MNTLNKYATTVLCCVLVLLMAIAAFGQETTGGLQGTVKDKTGAVINKAKVVVSSPALIGTKSLETDSSGYYRFTNLPPGEYEVTVTAQGFSTSKLTGIKILAGKLPTIDVPLQVGGSTETVEVSGAAPLVDVTQSKVATTITQDILQDIPKGRSFQSVIQLAPGSRTEPLQAPTAGYSNHQGTNQANGFQIDGASSTENAYLVEGQETASVFDGSSSANVPIEFIQEVQVKTSGFEAEYGGALGGVVNVIQKRGSNNYHGSFFTYYSGDMLNAAPTGTLRYNPATTTNGRFDAASELYQPKKDSFHIVEPGFELGGPIMKDRLWFFASSVPRFQSLTRTVNFSAPYNVTRALHEDVTTYYSLARLDFLATQKIRLFGSWQYGYERGTGTSFPSADSPYGQKNTSASTNPDNFNGGIGYVAPNVIYNTGADITLTPNLVATSRFGYFYQDYQDRGLPVGLRYIYRDTNYPYSTANQNNGTATFVGLDGVTHVPAPLQQTTSYSNIGVNQQTVFDKFGRYTFGQDLAYFKRFAGTHNIKVGYNYNHNSNNANSNAFNTADIYVAYGQPYSALTTGGKANCTAIIAANVAAYGAAAANAKCQGNMGTINFRDVATTGNVSATNHSLYVQDAWTIGHGLTINAGLRTEKESIPSYQPQLKGIDFDWTQKLAPRFGAAWDVLGNSKIKVFGSFGYFYQIMNLQLARGSWGGDYWHDCVYAMDNPDWRLQIPARGSDSHYCGLGGTTPATGSFTGLRFIENVDYRQPSNDPTQPGSLGPTGFVDPKLDPMKQHEFVAGSDIELRKNLGLEIRYSRKRLDRTIEDAGTITPNGELYYIVNPGYNVNATVPNCPSCPRNPKAVRDYDGLETRVTYRGSSKWSGSVSYTYSRLYGNYAGLTSTDQADSNQSGGRNGANSDRAFDEPYMSYDMHGKLINGPLSTDRPHTLKAYGYYTLKWLGMSTSFGGFQQVYSGTPLSSYTSLWGAPQYIDGRGNWVDFTQDGSGNYVEGKAYSRRTPIYSQTDFSLVHEIHVSKTNEGMIVGFEANVTNLFNQHSPVDYWSNINRTGYISPYSCDAPASNCSAYDAANAGYNVAATIKGYNFVNEANAAGMILSSRYGKPYMWQNPRSMRFKIRFSF